MNLFKILKDSSNKKESEKFVVYMNVHECANRNLILKILYKL